MVYSEMRGARATPTDRSPQERERMLRRLAEHHGVLSWLLEDLLTEIREGVDVSDLAPLLRSAGAAHAASLLEELS